MTGAEIQIEEGNYTRLHNAILEALAKARFTGSEYRLLMFLFRKTYGYGKKEDRISLTQWCEGTDMKRTAVCEYLARLVERRVITKEAVSLSVTYGFNKYMEQWDMAAASPPQGTTLQGTSPLQGTRVSPPQGTKSSPPQGTHKRKKETIKEISQERARKQKPSDPNLEHPAVVAYRDIAKKTPNEVQRALIVGVVDDVTRWGATITDWLQSGWNPLNIKGMVERYKEPRPWKGKGNGTGSDESSFGLRGDGRISPPSQETIDAIHANESRLARERLATAGRPDLPDMQRDALPAPQV